MSMLKYIDEKIDIIRGPSNPTKMQTTCDSCDTPAFCTLRDDAFTCDTCEELYQESLKDDKN